MGSAPDDAPEDNRSKDPPASSLTSARAAGARPEEASAPGPEVSSHVPANHPLKQGAKIVLKNLRHAEFNGLSGFVVDHVPKQERYIVHLDKLGRSMAVKERHVYVQARDASPYDRGAIAKGKPADPLPR